MRCLRFMNTKVTPCWIFVDALEQAHLFIHFNHSVPALILSSHRRQRFSLMLLLPVGLKQKTVMSGKVFAICPFCLLIVIFLYPPRGQVRCLSSLLSRKRTISLYSSPSMHLTAAVLCVRYTINVHVVMFNICLGLGGNYFMQSRIIHPGII